MQDFVLDYVKKKQAEFAAATEEASADRTQEKAAERDARLVRLGMCRREYGEGTAFSEEYPLEEHQSGRYYRLVPYEVSDEEYALICRYDDSPLGVRPHGLARTFSAEVKRVRRFAVLRFAIGFCISLALGCFLYLLESSLLLGAALLVLLGTALAFADASLCYAVAKNLKNTEYIMAKLEKHILPTPANEQENKEGI